MTVRIPTTTAPSRTVLDFAATEGARAARELARFNTEAIIRDAQANLTAAIGDMDEVYSRLAELVPPHDLFRNLTAELPRLADLAPALDDVHSALRYSFPVTVEGASPADPPPPRTERYAWRQTGSVVTSADPGEGRS